MPLGKQFSESAGLCAFGTEMFCDVRADRKVLPDAGIFYGKDDLHGSVRGRGTAIL